MKKQAEKTFEIFFENPYILPSPAAYILRGLFILHMLFLPQMRGLI
jgi:hypothetical protein